jgi:endonuclease III related protein
MSASPGLRPQLWSDHVNLSTSACRVCADTMKAVMPSAHSDLKEIYHRLAAARGPAGWWPGDSPFEVCLGAILTQNTAWTNVEKALEVLRERGLLDFSALSALSAEEIAPLIVPAGCFNVKARRVKAFLDFVEREYGGDVSLMALEDRWALRAKLLGVSGVGRETADCIVLYVARHPLFVVDAYTRRVFERLGFLQGGEPYDEVQRFFHERLPADAELFNDYHAQIVLLGKDVCRKVPKCTVCPLSTRCASRLREAS